MIRFCDDCPWYLDIICCGCPHDAAGKERDVREWAPIADAPKDREILLANFQRYKHGDPQRAWWQAEFARDGEEGWITACRVMTLVDGLTFDDGTTRTLHSPERYFSPTHWADLPARP